MRYAEYYRAKRLMLVVLIVLAAIAAIEVVAHLNESASYGRFLAWCSQLERAPGTEIRKQMNGDASSTIFIDNAHEGIHVRLRSGAGMLPSTQVIVPIKQRKSITALLRVPGGTTYETEHDGIVYLSQTYGSRASAVRELGHGLVVALIVATILGGALAKDSAEHLPLVWTRPITRARYAFWTIGVDICAIVLAALLGGLTFVFISASYGGISGPQDRSLVWAIPPIFLIPIAWYALLTAASASLRRGPAIATGLVCFLGFITFQLARITTEQPGPGAEVLSHIAQVVNVINPLRYLDNAGSGGAIPCAALGVLAVVYVTVAVIQWCRLEL